MANINLQFGIEDVVFTAHSSGPQKRIVESVRIDGEGVSYGFRRQGNGYLSVFYGGGNSYYGESDVFPDKKSAMARCAQLAEKDKEREAESERKRIEDLKETAEKAVSRYQAVLKGLPDPEDEEWGD